MEIKEIPEEVIRAKQRFGIVGNAPALIAAISRAIRVSPIDLSVLITGESGTGKEFFPQIIHSFSPRKHSKYIAVNCGAIPEGTIDSELFGHEKGAFTGAISSRKGYFEEADGGTIFLDEVAELPLTTQARLLRVLENGEFIKVGSSTVQKTNVRIVAATNVDMAAAVAEGRFREDLFYRLSTVSITVPPLRDRGNDIVLLARKFAADFAERYSMPAITLEESARTRLLHYRWPGNVRQLKNVVEQVALFDAGESVDAEALEPYIPSYATVYTPTVREGDRIHTYDAERDVLFGMILRLQQEIDRLNSRLDALTQKQSHGAGNILPRHTSVFDRSDDAPEASDRHSSQLPVRFQPFASHFPPVSPVGDNDVTDATADDVTDLSSSRTQPPMTLEDTEREMIRRSLERNGGRRKATARELNISERTLYRKIKEYGIE